DRDQKVGAHRHRHLGGGGRRRRAAVGGEIDQRHVGLVADRGDQRNETCRRRAHHDLLVERPQIFERAAAAGDDDKIWSPQQAPSLPSPACGGGKGGGKRIEAL